VAVPGSGGGGGGWLLTPPGGAVGAAGHCGDSGGASPAKMCAPVPPSKISMCWLPEADGVMVPKSCSPRSPPSPRKVMAMRWPGRIGTVASCMP
jgi:hypothetical protein